MTQKYYAAPTETEQAIATKTARGKGAVGRKAIVPRKVAGIISDRIAGRGDGRCLPWTVLDYGSGPDALHARSLAKQFPKLKVTAHDLPANRKPFLHDPLAVYRTYSIVYASNVLNVCSSERMLTTTVHEIAGCVGRYGLAVVNYPASPRKGTATDGDVHKLLCATFHRVERDRKARVWVCAKPRESFRCY